MTTRTGAIRKESAAGQTAAIVPPSARQIQRDPAGSEARSVYSAAATTLLFALSTAGPQLWLFGLFAPLPILATAPEISTVAAARLAFFAYALGHVFVLGGESHLVPISMLIAAHAVGAIVFATCVAAAAEAARRWSGIMAALVFPALLSSFYFAAGNESPYGSWGAVAYLQAGFTPLVETASVIGTSGITFVGSLLASGLAVGWYRRRWNMDWQMPVYVTTALFAFAILAGTIRMFSAPKAATVRVGLVAAGQEIPGSDSGEITAAGEVVTQYARLVRAMAPQGAQVVVLPERVVAVTPRYEFDVEEGFSRIASMSHVWLVAGFDQIDRSPKRNIAVVFRPDGKPALKPYSQHHPNPLFGDGYQPGHMTAIFDPPWGRTAVVIGNDLDFPDVTKELAAVGVKLVLAPAWDWPGSVATLREKMAMVGGVEGGFSVARAAREGLVSATDSRGREVAAIASEPTAAAVAVADLPVGTGPTFYSRGRGHLFPHLLIILTLFLFARLALSIRRHARVRQMYALKIATPASAPVAAEAPTNPEAPPPKKQEEEPEIYHAMTRPPPD